ncbi:MAG: CRISPR-associated endonuclease Cas2 [bacterium]|nr:CRISPR-associated endonuclease Cas2 [bacterium]MDT8396905.1 CRISPR-associated endonuclease Cas2 [bacterium]
MERLFIVAYDIQDPKRWRRVFKTMHGYGKWLQLSVFQCRLSRMRYLQMEALLGEFVNQKTDHVLILDMGPADSVKPRVQSIGRPFEPVERIPVIV